MQLREIEAMVGQLAPIIREYCALQTAPLLERIAALEARQPEKGEKGDAGEPGVNGKDIDPEVVKEMVAEAVAAIPAPQDGKDADPELVAGLVAEAVEKAFSGLPAPKDGADGKDGRDADPEMVSALVEEKLAEAMAGLEIPKGEKGDAGEQGLPGKDGVGLAGAVIDRGGNLVLTLTDGSVKELGVIVGRDGMPGADGKDGRDGLGIDNLDVTYDNERTFVFKWTGPGIVEERVFVVPLVLDRGVYTPKKQYERGDGVSFGGSFFIAQEPTSDKPETSRAWRLSTKRGRDGRDGVVKHEGKPVKVA